MNTPKTVPRIVPMPPNRLVPPITTAAIAFRLSVAWPPIVVVPKRAGVMEPAGPGPEARQRVDLDQVAVHVDAGAPHGLLVGADRVRVAAEARLREHDAEHDRHEQGHEHQPRDAGQAADAELADEVERHLALVDPAGDQQRGAQRHAEGAERDDEGGDLRLRDQEAVEQAPRQAGQEGGDEPEQDHAEALAAELLHHLGGDDAGEHEHGADRQVDAGGDDHVRRADRQHEQHGGVGRDVARVGDREELVERQQREDRDQADEDQPDLRAGAGQQPPHRSSSSWKVSAPVMADTTSSIETSSGRSRATRSPRRSTSMRSATSKISGRLWLMRTTARPWSRTRLIWSSTLRVWTTPSAAVGSSMNTTLLAQVTARLIAMPWRWPPDMLATGALVSWICTPRSRNASSLRRRISALSRKPSLPSGPPRMISRPRNMFAAGSISAASARSW